jgi:hypothetical protein
MNTQGVTRSNRRLMAAITAAGLAGLGSSSADAGLFMDLRATAVGGGLLLDSKHVMPTGIGDNVTLALYARVTGTDGVNNEALNSVVGLLNSVGSLKGNLTGESGTPSGTNPGRTTSASFSDSGFQNGSWVDWDSDGDLDIGASSTSSSSTGKWFARNATSGGLPMQNNVDANSGESLVGTFVWTVTALTGYDFAINFTLRNNNGGNVESAALWFQDGTNLSRNPMNTPVTIGLPVTVAPEPSSLGLLGLAGLGLLKRRRIAGINRRALIVMPLTR